MRLTGRDVLLIILVFFGITIAVNAVLIISAVRTFSGLDEPKSYAQGLHFEEVLKQRAEQKARGWRAAVTATRLSAGDTLIAVTIRDPSGKQIDGLQLEAALEYPATAKKDRPLTFERETSGSYWARVAGVGQGQWTLVVKVRQANNESPFELKRKLWIP